MAIPDRDVSLVCSAQDGVAYEFEGRISRSSPYHIESSDQRTADCDGAAPEPWDAAQRTAAWTAEQISRV